MQRIDVPLYVTGAFTIYTAMLWTTFSVMFPAVGLSTLNPVDP
jgi:hypothetical protein